MGNPFQLSLSDAIRLAEIPMRCIVQEYPNAPGLLLKGPEDLKEPHEIHPAFYGCLDWHSAVHMHWTLVCLLRRFDLPRAPQIREILDRHLSAENLLAETSYFEARPSFERPYGWAWLLMLAGELRNWNDPDSSRWANNVKPLEDKIVALFQDFLPKQTYPLRVGTHGNTAFALTLALTYARLTGNHALVLLIYERSREYYFSDRLRPAPLSYEPGGNDFLSPSLVEANLMSRVLDHGEFRDWVGAFLPDLSPLLTPAVVSDRSDGQLAHLDGLNLSRAWCLRRLAAFDADPKVAHAAQTHATAGIASLWTGDYMGEHWLASFAMLMQFG